ncbi:HAD-IA family hydrolase [Sphingomonas crocodyli]|uniref:HAD family hydrolase n=1 Tax=Sphingomonas crocodyli TaxID=1979270 RepID=A0A437M576_9SPHN|nr:HAD-IA family hydrolase [Sphingomonas crocodyli]RVT92695.1 HAD family hydrolase [Sphingomonas crocodyli]
MNRLALFDCDGTLADSQAIICRAMADAFAAEGLEPPADSATRRIVGLSLPQAIGRLIPEADDALHHHLAERYKQAFQRLRAMGQVDEPLFPGIAETLHELFDAGWMLGVATGKSDRGLAHILAAHKLTHLFSTLQTADRHPSKPHPSMAMLAMAETGAGPETTAMIGDTSFDIGMGIAAGCTTVGVAWGYHEAQELFDEGAHFVADQPGQLPAILETAISEPL